MSTTDADAWSAFILSTEVAYVSPDANISPVSLLNVVHASSHVTSPVSIRRRRRSNLVRNA